jgi:hypothetical protein
MYVGLDLRLSACSVLCRSMGIWYYRTILYSERNSIAQDWDDLTACLDKLLQRNRHVCAVLTRLSDSQSTIFRTRGLTNCRQGRVKLYLLYTPQVLTIADPLCFAVVYRVTPRGVHGRSLRYFPLA